MRHFNQGRFRHEAQFLRRRFLQDGDLPFTDVLSEDLVARTLTAVGVVWKDRIYTPLVTLWVFLSQVLSAGHSCRAAVARLIAHLVSRGEKPCSAQTGAYCQARERLPEKFFADVACSVGRGLDAKADPRWLWKGRQVYLFDGTTVTMPDTPENQEEYPQVYNQKPGLGFPIARVAVVKASLRATHGEKEADDLSGYYLALEIQQVHEGMMIALPAENWHVFQTMTSKQFALVLKEIAAHTDLARYRKSRRGPKKPPPKRTKYSNGGHVSTHKVLTERKK